MIKLTDVEYIKLRSKADKWNALNKKIAKYYQYDDDTGEPINEDVGDLCDIGLDAAIAFGYL